jgi:hypothetical protein
VAAVWDGRLPAPPPLRGLAGHPKLGAVLACFALVLSLAAATVGVAAGRTSFVVAPLAVAGTLAAYRAGRMHIRWTSVVALMLAVIFFIPIKRYALPGSAAVDLEPYRLVVALILLNWFCALLVDRRVHWHRTVLDRPLVMLLSVVLLSELTNVHRAASLDSYVIKSLTFFLSFVLVYYLVANTIRAREDIQRIVSVLVGFGAVVAVLALFESKSHVNVFNHLTGVLPILRLRSDGLIAVSDLERNGGVRAYASAQHPIALGAFLVLLLPLSFYLAQTRSRYWWLASFALLLGMLVTGSRTGVLMLFAVVLVYLILRPSYVVRFWPLLLPALVAVHIALPGTIGGLRAAFFPKGGLISQQDNVVRGNELRSNGRLADVGPALHEIGGEPLAGLGYGTRVTAGPDLNAAVLDDAWLGTLLEIGLLGMFAWLWIFVRSIRRLTRAAREDESERGWLLVALAAGIAAFGVGMFTYDAFSFIQVTFMLFILLGLASSVLALPPGDDQGNRLAALPGG